MELPSWSFVMAEAAVITIMFQWTYWITYSEFKQMEIRLKQKTKGDIFKLAKELQTGSSEQKKTLTARKIVAVSLAKEMYRDAITDFGSKTLTLAVLALALAVGGIFLPSQEVKGFLVVVSVILMIALFAYCLQLSQNKQKLQKYLDGEDPEKIFGENNDN